MGAGGVRGDVHFRDAVTQQGNEQGKEGAGGKQDPWPCPVLPVSGSREGPVLSAGPELGCPAVCFCVLMSALAAGSLEHQSRLYEEPTGRIQAPTRAATSASLEITVPFLYHPNSYFFPNLSVLLWFMTCKTVKLYM